MNWSAEQQRLLRALGHDLMVQGQAWPAPRATDADPVSAASARPVRKAPPAPVVGAAGPAPTQGREGNERLREALRRAAGGSDVSALIEDLERLRREPALKRALWPRLRALRRSH
jgi:hypothetical protein